MTRHSVILADPPCRFADRGSRIAPDHKQRHYATMTLADVKAAGVFVPKLELYARRRYSASWCAWGNQLEARPGESE